MRITQESIRRLHAMQRPGLASRRSEDDVVVRLGGGNRGLPLFLIHAVGGGVGCYLPLVNALDPPAAVYGLRHPGMLDAGGEHPGLSMLAQRYLSAVQRIQPEGPYRFGGWSLGGVIAYLMASNAQAAGLPLSPVLLIDSPPVGADGRFRFDESQPGMDARSLREDLAAGLQELVRIETDQRLDRQTLTATRSIYQSNSDALLACSIEPAVRSIWYVAAGSSLRGRNGPNSWRTYAREQFATFACAGNHYSILAPPQVAALAEMCRAWLAAT